MPGASAIRRVVVASCLACALAGSVPAAAASDSGETQALRWNPEWPKFRPFEYILAGIAGPLAIGLYDALPPQPQPHWVGGILFDDAVRNAIRLRSPGGLKTVRALADATGVISVVLVVGIDSILVPALRGSAEVTTQLTMMDLESFSLSSILTFSLYDSVGRARPSYVDCQHNGSFDVQCNTSPTASFPSGHASEVFTAAGLSCAHHGYLPLYGSKVADALACARDVTLATADGVMRIMGDRHYLTDVLAGGAIGFAFGYGMPVLLHYSMRRSSQLLLAPMQGSLLGLTATGGF